MNDRIERAVLAFLADDVGLEDAADLDRDTDLLQGILDSMSLLRLVAFLEDEFGIEVEDGDLTPSHFSTVTAVARLVSSRREPGG